MRSGARVLGLDLQWRYHFVGPGSRLEPTRDAVFVDVGGHLGPGGLDQHGSLGRSSAELVWRFPEHAYGHLMTGWLQRRDDGHPLQGRAWKPVLVTHVDPDFDGLVCCWLVQHLIEEGEFPPGAEALVHYASLVDQGEYRVDRAHPETATHALHLAYLAIQHLEQGPDRHAVMLRRGLALLETTLAELTRVRGHLYGLTVTELLPPAARSEAMPEAPAESAAAAWRKRPEFADVRDLLDQDLDRFAADERTADRTQILLPAQDGGPPLAVAAFFARQPPRSRLHKYWVRASGCPCFVCPFDPAGTVAVGPEARETTYPRVILSLDPHWSDPHGRKPSLRGLGFRLEQEEARRRKTGPTGDTRGLPPRWADGSCDNADPWYDGRDHGHTIVDSPRSGTQLPYARILELTRGPFWHVRLDQATVFLAWPCAPAKQPAGAGAAFPVATPLGRPPLMAPALDSWYAESGEQDATPLKWSSIPLPAGLELRWDRVRTFPANTAPPLRVLSLEADAPERATLEALGAWLDEQKRQHDGRLYTLARVRLEPGAGILGEPDRLLATLCSGAVSGSVLLQSRELVLFNERALALRSRRPAGDPQLEELTDLLRELLIYSAFVAETQQEFSRRVVELLAVKDVTQGSAIRRDYLRFLACYVHHEIVYDHDAAQLQLGLHGALQLEQRQAKTCRELEQLEQLERDAADQRQEALDRKTNLLLGLVGLLGIVEVICLDWSQVSSLQLGLAVGSLLILAVMLLFFALPKGRV